MQNMKYYVLYLLLAIKQWNNLENILLHSIFYKARKLFIRSNGKTCRQPSLYYIKFFVEILYKIEGLKYCLSDDK